MSRIRAKLRAAGAVALAAGLLSLPRPARAQATDVPDTLLRYGRADAVTVSPSADEHWDPYSGNLTIVQRDLALPQKGDLSLVLQRTYTSKIWGRADAYMFTPALAKANFIGLMEHSAFGPGWSMHLGRLRNPNGRGGAKGSGGDMDLPLFQGATGGAEQFYCYDGTGSGWNESTSTCSTAEKRSESGARYVAHSTPNGPIALVYGDRGLTFEFDRANAFCYGDDPCDELNATTGANYVIPVSKIRDARNNEIVIHYVANSKGAIDFIQDSYQRTITFEWSGGLCTAIVAGAARIDYSYSTVFIAGEGLDPDGPGGIPPFFNLGNQQVLTKVRLPGDGRPEWNFTYLDNCVYGNHSLGLNVGALRSITRPEGGTIVFRYGSWDRGVDFVTSSQADNWPNTNTLDYTHARMMPLVNRSEFDGPVTVPACSDQVVGTQLNSTEYSYEYDLGQSTTWPAPERPPVREGTQTTTVKRPDGKYDVYTLEGWGQKYDGSIWMVGMLDKVSYADGARVVENQWTPATTIPGITVYPAPWDGTVPSWRRCWDPGVISARKLKQVITQDGVRFVTDFGPYDLYGQARQITSYVDAPGAPHRVRNVDYFIKDAAPPLFLRGNVTTDTTCIGLDCVTNRNGYDASLGSLLWSEAADPAVHAAFTYQPDGELQSVTDPTGSVATFSGYDHGLATTVDLAGLETITRTASWEGRVLSETLGVNTTTYEYDDAGRLRIRTPKVGAREIHELSDPKRERVTHEGTSFFAETRWNGFHRTSATENSEGVLTQTLYDSSGRAWSTSYPYVGLPLNETFTYDGLDRITKTTHPDGTFTTAAQDGLSVVRTDEKGRTTRLTYEAFSSPDDRRLVSVTDPMSNVTTYQWDVAGNLIRTDEPGLSQDRTVTYDARRMRTSQFDPERGTTSYVVDDSGTVTSQTDALSATTFGHDALHRLTSIDASGWEHDATFTYDSSGRLGSSSTGISGTVAYTYDDIGRITGQTWNGFGQIATTGYVYDAAGCLTHETYPTGRTLDMTCDSLARTKTITGFVTDVQYHPSTALASFTCTNGKTTTFGRDNRYRLTDIEVNGVLDMSMTHDDVGNIDTITESGPTSSYKVLTFDDLDRMVTASGPWGMARFEYDAAGNRTRKSIDLGPATNYTYDAATGRLQQALGSEPSSYTWSPVGNMYSGNGVGYFWNVRDRLRSISSPAGSVTFDYDANLRKVRRTSGTGAHTLYDYDKDGRKIAEVKLDGSPAREYIRLGGRLIAIAVQGNNLGTRFVHLDQLNGIVATTSTSGMVLCRESYGPYGETTGPGCEEERYDGRDFESAANAYDYDARWYHPATGRFLGADTFEGSQDDPQTHGRYTYVRDNPMRYTDPTGHCMEQVGTMICVESEDESSCYCWVSDSGGGSSPDMSMPDPISTPDQMSGEGAVDAGDIYNDGNDGPPQTIDIGFSATIDVVDDQLPPGEAIGEGPEIDPSSIDKEYIGTDEGSQTEGDWIRQQRECLEQTGWLCGQGGGPPKEGRPGGMQRLVKDLDGMRNSEMRFWRNIPEAAP